MTRENLTDGVTVRERVQTGLEEADVLACIAYGAEMMRERFVEIPIEAKP